jgi:transglutaminase-like putative cysteine protease
MKFDRALRLTSVLLASVSFVALVLGTSVPGWLAVLAGSALILALLRTLEFQPISRIAAYATLSTATWNVLVLAGFVMFWVDSLWISGELLPAGIHFLLILMVIKLGNLELPRDYLHLYAISLVAILAAASLTADLWYLPIFVAYLLTGVWTLLLFQMTNNSGTSPSRGTGSPLQQETSGSSGRVTANFFWLANGLACATLGLTLVIFFAMPRVGAGLYHQRGYGENIRTSGFSNTVDLGSIGPIKRDQSIVMRVELPDRAQPRAERLYLRGSAFDRYNGRSWANQLGHRRVLAETSPGTFALNRRHGEGSPSGESPLRQNILLEPLDTPILFAAPFAETVSGKFPAVQADSGGALYMPFSSSARIEYSVVSRSNPVWPADLHPQPISYSAPFLRYFTQVPVQSDRISNLAQAVVQDKHNAYERTIAIRDHLTRNYRYSLDAPLAEQADPLEEFLFNRKTGYCEHYATAMVVMLRTVGIPARLITGFLATEWNEYGNYYVVRQQDAHAWVEVHLPHSGWVMMDPTPPSEESVAYVAPAWQAWERILDNVRLRWNRMVVQYGIADQLAVVRGLEDGGVAVRNRAWDSVSAIADPLAAAIRKILGSLDGNSLRVLAGSLISVLLALCLLFWLVRKRRWSGIILFKAARPEEPVANQLYDQMITHLGHRGFLKPPTMAPFEFLGIIQQQWTDASSPVGLITELYCRGRFGHMPLTAEEHRSAQRTLQQLMSMEHQALGKPR